MNRAARLAGIGGLALAATTLFAAPASAHPTHFNQHRAAVFVQSDDPSGNTVAAFERDASGRLTLHATYPTRGNGGVLAGSVVDHLASQGSLQYDRSHRLLYVVNAGSNSLTVFEVRGADLERRQVIGSGGDFPVSIAVHRNVVYVLNARDGGSVQGFRLVGERLVRVPSWHRDLGLDAAATPEFTHTPGQVVFTPNGSKLIVTTKANTNALDVFFVHRSGALSSAPVVTTLAGAVPFAATFDPHGHLVVAEAGTNAVATFSVRRDGTLSGIDSAPTGQAATCWIIGADHAVFASNAGSASLSGFHVAADGTLAALGNTATDNGTVDAVVSSDGRYLYAQTGAAGIIDEFAIGAHGSLTPIGSLTVADAVGAEGIAAS
jgi:6-phosphogluconolactonase (cycloisomerase 2 family)